MKRPKRIFHESQNLFSGLVCDEPLCGYQEVPDSFGRHLIGRRCRYCGSNMLTERQYHKAKRAIRAISIVNFLFGWAFGTREPPDDGTPMEVSVTNKTRIRVAAIGDPS